MAALFWILWSLDLVIGAISLLGKNFRRSFTASDPTAWFDIILFSGIIGGLLLKVFFKRPLAGLILAALPLAVLLVWFLIDKMGERP